MTYLRDLLPKDRNIQVEYRCNSPEEDEGDMLFGFCNWIDGELIAGDGDNYYLNDVITRHVWDDDEHLVVWIEVVWNLDKANEGIFQYALVEECEDD